MPLNRFLYYQLKDTPPWSPHLIVWLCLIPSVNNTQHHNLIRFSHFTSDSQFINTKKMASCPPFDFSGKYYQTSGDACLRQSNFFGGKAVLNQGVGYSVILGFGAFFAFFTSFLVSTTPSASCTTILAHFWYIVGVGLGGETLCRSSPYVGVVQHRRKKRQNWTHSKCYCISGKIFGGSCAFSLIGTVDWLNSDQLTPPNPKEKSNLTSGLYILVLLQFASKIKLL